MKIEAQYVREGDLVSASPYSQSALSVVKAAMSASTTVVKLQYASGCISTYLPWQRLHVEEMDEQELTLRMLAA